MPCEVCDANVGPVLEYHHIIPFEHGGPHTPRNLVKLCPTCHAFVSRDQCQWASWTKHGVYPRHAARRLGLLACIQHAPGDAVWGREDAWEWLHALTGFEPDDIPGDADWGNRWAKDAKAEARLARQADRYERTGRL